MLFSLLVLAAVPQGQVHVVDAADGPGADFTEIRDAVAAAADGDVVLVRDGDYRFSAGSFVEGVRLDGRGLTVVAEAGADVRTQSLLVENLPAASQVLVQGVRFVSSPFDSRFDANQGPVWLERCILGPNGCVCVLEREYALHATDCAAVVVSRCSLSAPLNDFAEGTAILAEDSRLHVWESVVLGFSFGEFEALGAITLREAPSSSSSVRA